MIELMRGCDVVFNAIAPRMLQPETYCNSIKLIIEECKAAHVPKLLSVIGSSSALVGKGTPLLESDYFEEANRSFYQSICKSEEIYKHEHELNWGCITPAAFMETDSPVRREYRKGDDWLIIMDGTPDGSEAYFDNSQISLMDFAYACVDELEKDEIHRRRCCVGYPNRG
jgi:putative NADH-flavin reductase